MATNHRERSGWTTDDILNCQIVEQWLLEPDNVRHINRMKSLDYNDTQMNYDCAKWKKAWQSMELTKEEDLPDDAKADQRACTWQGIPQQMAQDVPAVYKKVIGTRSKDGMTFTFDPRTSMSTLEYMDISASADIQTASFGVNGLNLATQRCDCKELRFKPFSGGFLLKATPYCKLDLTITLSVPGDVVVKAYYTRIPDAD